IPQLSLKVLSSLVGLILFGIANGQAVISGTVIDEFKMPLMDVRISDGTNISYSNQDGNFSLEIPADTDLQVRFELEGKLSYSQNIQLSNGEKYEFNVMLVTDEAAGVELVEAIIFQRRTEKPLTSISFKPEEMETIVGLTGGPIDMIKTLPSVNSNTELSSQYMVRGGNYDENLIYVNGIEVYKPQLIRSGEQEGLGFVNPYMTEAVNFSAGGWEAKYGDKMSSVLDIIYKRPKKFEASLEASL